MPSSVVIEQQTTALAVIERGLKKDKRRLRTLLPDHITADRAIETVLAAARRTPELLDCTPESFVFALRESARWGLIPDGIMGQGYLIPRRNGKTGELEANFQAGYRGLEDLARRTGVVASIISGWHCANDPVFRVRLGFGGDIEHEPAFANRGDIVGFYAGAWLTNGAPPIVVYMEASEVIAIRDAVPKWNLGPWRSHFAMMGRKTAVRRLIPQLPLSADIQAIVALDEEPWERAKDVTPPGDDEPTATTKKAERMRGMLESRHGEANGDGAPEFGPATSAEPPPESEPVTERISGTVRLPDAVGLNGIVTDTPAGDVIGFRLDLDERGEYGDEWVQVVLSGDVLARYRTAAGEGVDQMLTDGGSVTVVGQRVIVSRAGKTPVIRYIATEDIEWPSP
jgi:phage RecT family recombinase